MFGLYKKVFGFDPRTHRQEIGGSWSGHKTKTVGLASGLVHGTRVATAMGWRDVDALAVGDLVLTFDRGMQPIRAITRGALWQSDDACPESLWPLKVPVGAIGNNEPMILLPEQPIMVESDAAEELFGDPFSLINAADLDGFRGIERAIPMVELDVVQLHFDNDEVVFAASGALLFCASLQVINMAELLNAHPDAACYMVLPQTQAELLIEFLIDEDFEVPSPNMTQEAQPSATYA